jgi:DNA-binding winged helix-turn-helix (wHTH) protein
VRVDGQPRECSRKALELLLILVRNADRVVSRDAAMDALWPGGQVVSDEALTQLVFRTRAVLGPYAPLLKTLRGIGLRLDADVSLLGDAASPAPADRTIEALDAATNVATSAPASAPAKPGSEAIVESPASIVTAAAVSGRGSQRWRHAAAILALLLTLSIASWAWRGSAGSSPILDEGYGLNVSDARVTHAESLALIAEALHNEARGERKRGALTLEKVHAADPTTPVPALMLALWTNGDGDGEAGTRWLAQARERVGLTPDLYYDFLLEYVSAELTGSPQQIIDSAGAVLNVRPHAWRMHSARAHLMEYIGMRTAALQEAQKIEVHALGHRRLDMAIADRASMGDPDGAAAMLDRLDAADDPAMYSFLRGRIAWSRGDFAAAESEFSRTAATALDAARIDLRVRSLLYAGVIQVMRGDDAAALTTIEAARSAFAGQSVLVDTDLSLLLAQLHAASGREEAMNRELDRALATPPNGTDDLLALSAVFTAMRLRPTQALTRPVELSPAAAALWDAFAAWQQQRSEDLTAALAMANQHGIGNTRWADDARWLQLRAGLRPDPPVTLDPPHPPLSRVVLRRLIRAELARQGEKLPVAP